MCLRVCGDDQVEVPLLTHVDSDVIREPTGLERDAWEGLLMGCVHIEMTIGWRTRGSDAAGGAAMHQIEEISMGAAHR